MINKFSDLNSRLSKIESSLSDLNKNVGKKTLALNELYTYKKNITKIIQNKLAEIIPKEDKSLKKKEKDLILYKEFLQIEKEINNYRENLGFNLLIYNLINAKSLIDFNQNLNKIIKIFKMMDIELTSNNFNYSVPVNIYMKNLFMENKKSNLNAEMKKTFNDLYWNNHKLLDDIIINMRLIIDQNEEKIHEHLLNRKSEFIKSKTLSNNPIKTYNELIKKIEEQKRIDPYSILESFVTEKYDIDNYLNITKLRAKIISNKEYETLNDEEIDAFYESINNLHNNLYEYENYEEFKFLIEKVKEITEKKEFYLNVFKIKKAKIKKLLKTKEKTQKEINILNKSINKLSSFNILDNQKNKIISKINIKLKAKESFLNNIIDNIRKEYKNYDESMFIDSIINSISEDTLIYNILKIYNENSINLMNNLNEVEYIKFNKFINSPYIQIIKSIKLKDNFELNRIIEEKYKLFDFDVKIDKIGSKSFEELRKNCYELAIYRNIRKAGYIPEDIKFIIEISKENDIFE